MRGQDWFRLAYRTALVSLAGAVIWLAWRAWEAHPARLIPALAITAVVLGLTLLLGARRPGIAAWWLEFVGFWLVLTAAMLADIGQWRMFQPIVPSVSSPPRSEAPDRRRRSAIILAINDTYRIEPNRHLDIGGMARVRSLRREREAQGEAVLLLHAGDFLSPSLLSREFAGEQMVATMNLLDGSADEFDRRFLVVIGNHEFDQSNCIDAKALAARIAQAQFGWLAANVDFYSCNGGQPMLPAAQLERIKRYEIVTVGGIKIGVFGLTIDLPANPKKPPPSIGGKAARAKLARELSQELRKAGAEVVVALTHLDQGEDREILAAFPPKENDGRAVDGPDLLIGGHDHERMVLVGANGRLGYKADSDAQSVSELRLTIAPDGRLDIAHRFVALDISVPEDPQVRAEVESWQRRFEEKFCTGQEADCLDQGKAVARVALDGDERKIRRERTSLGVWVATEMLEAAATCAPPANRPSIALINSGSLRLNRDIPAGARLTVRDIAELFGFASQVEVAMVPGRSLKAAMARSREGQGTGAWLQYAGLSQGASGDLTDAKGQAIRDDERYAVALTSYLLDPANEDRYDFRAAERVPCAKAEGLDLRERLIGKIKSVDQIDMPRCDRDACQRTSG